MYPRTFSITYSNNKASKETGNLNIKNALEEGIDFFARLLTWKRGVPFPRPNRTNTCMHTFYRRRGTYTRWWGSPVEEICVHLSWNLTLRQKKEIKPDYQFHGLNTAVWIQHFFISFFLFCFSSHVCGPLLIRLQLVQGMYLSDAVRTTTLIWPFFLSWGVRCVSDMMHIWCFFNLSCDRRHTILEISYCENKQNCKKERLIRLE